VTEEQYQDLIARLERIEAHQQSEGRWGIAFLMAMGTATLLFAMDEPAYAFGWLTVYFFVKAYRMTVATIPPESREPLIMREGEDGEPDRPTRVSSLGDEHDTKSG
jgi:hypothetical protein